jgi:hypothetical protein
MAISDKIGPQHGLDLREPSQILFQFGHRVAIYDLRQKLAIAKYTKITMRQSRLDVLCYASQFWKRNVFLTRLPKCPQSRQRSRAATPARSLRLDIGDAIPLDDPETFSVPDPLKMMA